MSLNRKISKKRLSSKKKKTPVDNAQRDVLFKIGLEAFWTKPLDQATMLDISTWSLENQPPLVAKYLPRAFLQRLWLLNPEARSPCLQAPPDDLTDDTPGIDTLIPGLGEDSQCPVNPLDLVTAVYMSADCFLQQEITLRMAQCQFAVPLLLPPMNPDQQGCFLLWPLRAVVGQWRQRSPAGASGVLEGDMASTQMPLVSCIKLGHCSVSKSRVLNQITGGPQRHRECFLHRGMDGGELPRRLSNGLVELGWYLPSGDKRQDVFPQPIAFGNLRGDAAEHEKQVSLLCRASSAVVVFCGNIQEKERHLLASWKSVARQIILIDLSDPIEVEKDEYGVTIKKLGEYLVLPEGAVLSGCGISEEELAKSLKEALNNLTPDKLSSVTLEAASSVAEELGLSVDEGTVCRKALAQVEEVLRGLEEGAAQYTEQQLPLQGAEWKRLAGVEKEQSRQKDAGEVVDQQLQIEKRSLLQKLGGYKMTVAMRIFTDALCTADKTERAYFLSWMRLRLQAKQRRQYPFVEPEGQIVNVTHNEPEEEAVKATIEELGEKAMNGTDEQSEDDDDSFTTGSTVEEVQQEPDKQQQLKVDPSSVGLEHFLREMGLIFELTHSSPGSGNSNILRLPSVATDLLLYGVPLEILDGDASAVPQCWLGCVMADFHRRLQPEGARFRVVTAFGVHGARNAEVFSALFGVNFPNGRGRCTRGAYMLALSLPDDLKKDMECDFLLMVDVEGLCTPGTAEQGDTLEHDNEMATLVTGLSDVMLHNMPPDGDTKMQTTLEVTANALLRARGSGIVPIGQLLTQGIGLDSKLLSLQLKRVTQILEPEAEEAPVNSSIPCLIGPWQNNSLSVPVDEEYSKVVLELKQNLFQALTKCAAKSKATGLPEFTGRLCGVWETVQGGTLSIGLRDTDVAEAFCMLCTELSQWEKILKEHLESWLSGAQEQIITRKLSVLKRGDQADPLDVLKKEGRTEVKAEVDKIRSTLMETLKKDDLHRTHIETYKPNFLNYLDTLQEQMIHEVTEKLESVTENHYSTTTLKSFQTVLEAKQEAKLHSLVETCKIDNSVLEDNQLEEDFETVWSDTLSNFDFRPSEKDNITTRVTEILKKNLTNRGLLKHLKKLDDVCKENNTLGFIVLDEHFGYRSRLKHMFEENNRLQKLEAHRLASRIINEYNGFLAEKSVEIADFSDSYITELLTKIDKALMAKPMEIRSLFEVDLKVYLCSYACRDFQAMHDRYARDRDFLVYLNGTKDRCLGEFVYQFRKRDQCQRVARAFKTVVLKPAALDYIYRPLGNCIMEEMVSSDNTQQYLSPQAFHCGLLEELIEEDSFESFLEYLLSYESFSLKRIQDRLVGHITGSATSEERRQQRLGEIVGKMAAAVSQTSEGVSGVQSDTKLLLEKVCLVLEAEADVTVSRDYLQGPMFQFTTEWDRFVSCLMESLAEMRLELAQEFSQNSDVSKALQAHPGMPQKSLFNRVRGCGRQCPFCKAPCEAGESDHEVHRALLHRPKGMLSYTCADSSSLSYSTCPSDMARENLFLNKDTEGQSLPYREYRSLYPDWSILPEDSDSQRHSAYWRYVLVRFNSRFAQEYQREPAQLPEEWKEITQEEALESLREALHTEQC